MNEVARDVLQRLITMKDGRYHLDLTGLLLRVNTADREAAVRLEEFLKEHEDSGRTNFQSISLLVERYATVLGAVLQDESPEEAFDDHRVEVAFNVLWWFYLIGSLSSTPGSRTVI